MNDYNLSSSLVSLQVRAQLFMNLRFPIQIVQISPKMIKSVKQVTTGKINPYKILIPFMLHVITWSP